MKITRHEEDIYPATVPAGSRCPLCGYRYEFAAVVAVVNDGDADACLDCAALAESDPGELRRRMVAWAGMLRSQADELESMAAEPFTVEEGRDG